MKQPIKKLPIPAAEEVKKHKKALFLKQLDEKITQGVEGEIAHLARELTEKYEAEKLIAYLLDKSLPKKFFEATDMSRSDSNSREGFSRDSRDSRGPREWSSRSSSSERPAGGFTLKTRDGQEKTFGAGRSSEKSKDFSYPRRESSAGDSETMRLFIARGKQDNVFPRDVLSMIEADAGVSLKYVKKVEIYDSFSYMDVNRRDGEQITRTYKQKNSAKPLIVEAKRKG